jgi:predicted small integral membrane protein
MPTTVTMDRPAKGKPGTVWLGLAGQNALLANLLAPIIYALFVVMADAFGTTNWYAIPGPNPWAGLGRGVLLAIIICVVAGSLRRGDSH